jgi:hypothetical protein
MNVLMVRRLAGGVNRGGALGARLDPIDALRFE